MPGTREEALPLLVPALRPRIKYSPLPDDPRSERERAFGLRRVGSHLVLRLAVDLPQVLLEPGREDLERWGLRPREAFQAARRNLLGRSQGKTFQPFMSAEELGKGSRLVRAYRSPWRDNLDGGRLALTQLFADLDIEGDPVVAVPNRDLLIVTGSEDPEGLALLLIGAKEALGDPGTIAPMPIVLRDGDWQDWAPPASSPLRELYRQATEGFLFECYTAQKDAIQRATEEWDGDGDEPPFASSVFGVRLPWGSGTMTTWGEGADSVLPITDAVSLVRSPGSSDGAKTLLVPWERLVDVCGELLEPTELYPPRVRVRTFPDVEQLERLSAFAIPAQDHDGDALDGDDLDGEDLDGEDLDGEDLDGEEDAGSGLTPEQKLLLALGLPLDAQAEGDGDDDAQVDDDGPPRTAGGVAPRTALLLAEPLLPSITGLLRLPRGKSAPPPPPAGQAVLELYGTTRNGEGWVERAIEPFSAQADAADVARRACEAFADRWDIVDGACQLRAVEGSYLFLVDGQAGRRSERIEDPGWLARFASLFASGWAEATGER